MVERISVSGLLAALVALAPISLLAYVEAPDDPPLETLIASQPIVVLASGGELVRRTQKGFPAVEGDIDSAPGYTEAYAHYRFEVVERLKGELPQSFELRVIADEKASWQPDFSQGGHVVMVLAPDAGSDEGFLVAHRAAYSVTGGQFEARSGTGTRTWTIDELRQATAEAAERVEQRRRTSPEPPEAALDPVVAGEDTPRDETPPPEAVKTREHDPRSETELADAVPREVHGPEDEEVRKPPRVNIVLIVLALVVLALVLWLILRRRSERT